MGDELYTYTAELGEDLARDEIEDTECLGKDSVETPLSEPSCRNRSPNTSTVCSDWNHDYEEQSDGDDAEDAHAPLCRNPPRWFSC